MKTVSVAKAQSDIEAVLDSAQNGSIVVTRAGRPSAVIVGVESYDAEDLALACSPSFWQLIESRRKGRSIPLSQVKRRLDAREQRESGRPVKNNRKGPRKPHGSRA